MAGRPAGKGKEFAVPEGDAAAQAAEEGKSAKLGSDEALRPGVLGQEYRVHEKDSELKPRCT
jgi:hypothetical protein